MTVLRSGPCVTASGGACNNSGSDAWTCSRWLCVFVAAIGLVVSAGCASGSKAGADATPLTTKVEPLSEFLSRAQASEALAGGRERARLIYRDAAKAYPADKRPWARLAQSYFDSGDYGNAVLAAQEVVQRDAGDSAAQGLLAVSGLRISTAALSALRNQNGLNTSTRSEAEDMARNLRSILGEAVLVPKPAEASTSPLPAPQAQPRARRVVRGKGAAAPAPTPPVSSGNPFGALQ